MTAGDQGDMQPPLIHRLSSGKRKRRGFPVVLVYVGVALAFAGGVGVYLWKAPATPAWLLPEGIPSMSEVQRCLREQDTPCAEADLIAYTKKYPNDSHAVALLAITLTQDGRHKESLYYYKKADAMGVVTYDFYANWAKSLDATGNTDEAIQKNQAALKIVPRLVDVRGALADELVKRGRPKEALDLLDSFDHQLEDEGQPAYFTAQRDRIRMQLGGDYARQIAAEQAPDKPQPGQTLVKGEALMGTLAVPVSVNGSAPMTFMVDSGASLVSIPYDEAAPLLRSQSIRPVDFRGVGLFQLANGTRVSAQVYNIHSIKVGGREVRNVLASIYLGHGPRLLGQSFLKRFKSWSVDNRKRELVLEQ
jgi:clan AA aspartic protease (TIGR02281 family)